MDLQVKNFDGAATSCSVSDQVFSLGYNESLVHQVVVAHANGARSGEKAQKTRSEVRGGGAKPWRQKGTGRARAGTIRSPIWKGGGVTFAAKPRDFSQKVNRKMYRKAMASILSEAIRQERLTVVSDFSLAEPKTKRLIEKLVDFDLTKRTLILTVDFDSPVYLAARNIPTCHVALVSSVDPVLLVGAHQILVTEAALKKLEEKLL